MAEPDGVQHAVVDAVLADPVVQAVLATSEGAPTSPVAATVAPPTQPGQAGGTEPAKPDVMFLPSGQPIAAPTTTEEEDRSTVGQRRINLIWEFTQGVIAILVTGATLYVAGALALRGNSETAAFLLLSNAFFVVVTTYIVRTNHSNIGGVRKGDTGR